MSRHITGEDVFNVIEVKDAAGLTIKWTLQFKNGKDYDEQFKSKESAEWEADRWVRKNPGHELVSDAIFERDVLEEVEAPTGLEPVLTD